MSEFRIEDVKALIPADREANKRAVEARLRLIPPADMDEAQQTAVAEVIGRIGDALQPQIVDGLLQLHKLAEGIYGPRASFSGGPDGWDAELGEMIEKWTDADIRSGAGVDAIGEALNAMSGDPVEFEPWAVRTGRAWSEDVARGAVKKAGLSASKLLSAAGIVAKDLKPFVAADGASSPAPKNDGPTVSEDLAAACGVFDSLKGLGATSPEAAAAMLGGPDGILQGIGSSEPAFRGSALTRLGATSAQIKAFERLVAGGFVTAQEIINAAFETKVPDVAKSPKGGKPTEKTRKRDAQVTPVNDVVAMLLAHAGLTAAELGERINGMSRTAVSNIAKGKTGWEPDGPGELAGVRALVDELRVKVDEADEVLRAYRA